MSTLKQSINEQFISVIAGKIFEQTNDLSTELDGAARFSYFQRKLEELNDNLISYSAMIDAFIAGNEELAEAVADANDDIPEII